MIIVQASGWEVRADDGADVRVRSPGGLEAAILHTFDFNSELARMSTIVDCGEAGALRAMVKGSPESIADLCQLSTCVDLRTAPRLPSPRRVALRTTSHFGG